MTKISIPIISASKHEGYGALLLSGVALFVFGLATGGLLFSKFTLTSYSPDSLIAGVGGSDVDSTNDATPIVPLSTDDTVTTEVTDAVIESAPVVEFIPIDENGDSLNVDSELFFPEIVATPIPTLSPDTRERYTAEIERIKNNSIELIVEFRVNCGAWNDICADPYRTQLDRYNTRYEELERLLR